MRVDAPILHRIVSGTKPKTRAGKDKVLEENILDPF